MSGVPPPPFFSFFSKPWVDFNLINRFGGAPLQHLDDSSLPLPRDLNESISPIKPQKEKANIFNSDTIQSHSFCGYHSPLHITPSYHDIPPANHGCPTYATGTEPISKNLRHPSIPHLFFEQFSRHFNRWPLLIHHGPRTICRGGSNLPTNGKAETLVLHCPEFALLDIARKARPRKQPPGFLLQLYGDEVGTLRRNDHVFPCTTDVSADIKKVICFSCNALELKKFQFR
ncbi:hypothetical protein TNCT_263791 [Trichonephila clavata]|uniref:Uncharacterized protein n=1 Tax=Trichonephila clavata TaxID=2740835 RepID=A0A8X6M313_TRICU|nr:hypothetical protein TNCT_263791 [Trichonephila clavata]